ncbi:translation elongation factor Ts [Candidatus Wirthbacteria bacterium CG2_30_54_11]|uniref:Elongation factor Ts n=1 Tax=Candidatus Wirthbacteria bacterium CG2_30_54_11 TaxID=1817892 RepID=A0A1J5IL83_9BACT|nr:MAG: translation elongation factor Ts [Candidatus Wirthbacteria bacterium CG2_30_54_11]
MATITAQQVKTLRDTTGAGMMYAKQALVEANGDTDKAIDILRTKGLAKAGKKASRDANEGLVECYLHAGGKLGVLLEINCETDFVARTDEFKQLAHDIAMHIAATSPSYVSVEEVPAEVVAKEKEIYLESVKQQGKPAEVADKIAGGKLEKFYDDVCLLRQAYVKDSTKTIQDILNAMIAKMGENIKINRFARFQIGA